MAHPETSPPGPEPSACPACGRDARWESLLEGDEERWFSACLCGRMRAHLPDRPELDPDDPVRA